MSKLADQLRAAGVYNTHDILKLAPTGLDVGLLYTPGEARGGVPKTAVYSPSHQTRPDAPWYNYGCEAFVGKRVVSMPQAEAWALEKYGIADWVPCPLDRSSKIPAAALNAAKYKTRNNSRATK